MIQAAAKSTMWQEIVTELAPRHLIGRNQCLGAGARGGGFMARRRHRQVTGLCLLLAALAVCAGVRPLRVGAGGSADRLQAWYSDISDSVPPTLLTEDGLVTREALEPGQVLLRLPQAGWITAGGEDGCTAGTRSRTGLASEEVLRLAQRLVLLRDDCSRHLTTQFCAYVGARACEFQY